MFNAPHIEGALALFKGQPKSVCHSRYCTGALRVCRRPMRTSLFVKRNFRPYKTVARLASDRLVSHRYQRRRNTWSAPPHGATHLLHAMLHRAPTLQ